MMNSDLRNEWEQNIAPLCRTVDAEGHQVDRIRRNIARACLAGRDLTAWLGM
jgi:hypothetical protein